MSEPIEAGGAEVAIRAATPEDVPMLLGLIIELAEYEAPGRPGPGNRGAARRRPSSVSVPRPRP